MVHLPRTTLEFSPILLIFDNTGIETLLEARTECEYTFSRASTENEAAGPMPTRHEGVDEEGPPINLWRFEMRLPFFPVACGLS